MFTYNHFVHLVHLVQNIVRSTFRNYFLLKLIQQISLAVVNYTQFKRKRSLKVDPVHIVSRNPDFPLIKVNKTIEKET